MDPMVPMVIDFDGSIVNSRFNATAKPHDISGYPIVMTPTSAEDVASAVKAKVLTRCEMIVSSGIHSTTNDAQKVGTGAIVLDMRYFKDIKVVPAGDHRLNVEVATTLGELGQFLVEKGGEWFLPLGDNLSKSVVSTVKLSYEGLYVRSQGLLKDFVKKIHFINEVGQPKFSSSIDDLANFKENVITSFEFECKMKPKSLCCIWFCIPYTETVFNNLIENVLQQSPSYDLHIRVRKDVHGIPFVCATVACNGNFDAKDCIVEYLTNCENGTMRECNSTKEVVEASLEAGFSGGLEYYNLDCTMHVRELLQGKEGQFCKLVEAAFGDDNYGIFCSEDEIIAGVSPDVKMIAGVRLTATGGVEAQVYLYTAKEMSKRERELKKFVELVMVPPAVPLEEASLPPSFETHPASLRSERERELKLIKQVKTPETQHGSDILSPKYLMKSASVPSPRIPNFTGKVYLKSHREYATSTHQYATSSYPDDQKRMSPHMAAYPMDVKDVMAAVLYAKGQNKKIVTRSGGHQYCGLSSGGDDTILLIMEKFNKLEVRGNIAVVGPGCRLVDLAKAFKQKGVTIPHGECPFVCIGGHVQTGGFGHLLRSFGLALDHVKSFDMVLSNGTLKTFSREERDDLYWAVLGGGPGSFGVITEIRFDCIRDVDHPKSFGYNGVFYFKEDVFKRAMQELASWGRKIYDSDANFPEDVDLVLSVTSHSWNPFRPFPVMLLEMVHGNFKGVAQTEDETDQARKVFEETLGNIETKPLLLPYDEKRSRFLSDMSDSFVRQVFSGTTFFGDQGREFSFPYLKRLNVFEKPLTSEFVNDFTTLVDEVINGPDRGNIKVVVQMFLGGGQVRKLGGEQSNNSISGRNYTVGVVFDIFYNDKTDGMKAKAEDFQRGWEI
ncbi:FAD-binding domain-containing protein [Fragilaria crotonensis]|nr:FAD-binding domain-containing protein [Fragilaria crotonensis]